MENFDIYKDIATRTGGDIYIGVVGPVRSGKSTLVKKLTERLILPNIADQNKLKVAIDETPQSAGGKTVMTTEPKFVPSEAVSVRVGDALAKIRLIDCVGYMVDGAHFEDEEGKPRLVRTPWNEEELPFDRAAEIGTEKVIKEHSTIGLVVTSDGSFTDIERGAYAAVEERVIKELKSADKPFIVLFNTKDPSGEAAQKEALSIEKRFGVSALPVNVESLSDEDIDGILFTVLKEFPIVSFDVVLPKWTQALDSSDEVIRDIIAKTMAASEKVFKMKDVELIERAFIESEDFEDTAEVTMDMAVGKARIAVNSRSSLFYKVLTKISGEAMQDEFSIMNYVNSLSVAKREYQKLKNALESAETSGYGISMPLDSDTEYEQAEVKKTVGGFAVKMRAKTKCLHVIKTDINAEVPLISGTKEQCDSFAESVNQGDDGMKTEIFGKPVQSVINEGIMMKCNSLSEPIKGKIKRTLTKAVNEKKSNLICLLI